MDLGKYKAKLIKALSNSHEYTIRKAAEYLRDLDADEALPALLKAVSHEDYFTAKAAVNVSVSTLSDGLFCALFEGAGTVANCSVPAAPLVSERNGFRNDSVFCTGA